MPMRTKALALLPLLLSGVAHAATGGAAVTLAHSGYLLDATDTPLDATVTLKFRVFASAAAGTLEWEGTCANVPVSGGYFAVTLGSAACPGTAGSGDSTLDVSDLPPGSARWLEVVVGSVVLEPRLQVSAVPAAVLASRALNSDTLEGHAAAFFAEAGHTHDAGAIVSGKLANALLHTGSGGGLDADSVDGLHADDLAPIVHSHDGAAITTGKIDNARLKTGAGNLLDADSVDGLHASAFALANHSHSASQITDFASAAVAALTGATIPGSLTVTGGLSGTLKLAGASTLCNPGSSGTLRWSGAAVEVCDGSNWVQMATTAQFVTNPTGVAPAFTEPAENKRILTTQRRFAGTCDSSAPVEVIYGSGATGAVQVPCTGGKFAFNASFSGVDGARSVTARQSPLQATRNVNFQPSYSAPSDGLNGIVYSIAAVPDGTGDVYIGGSFTQYGDINVSRLLRLDGAGRRNNAFSVGAGFNSTVYAIVPRADGRVYVGGAFTSFDSVTQNYIARLKVDGTLDTTFAVGAGFNGAVYAIEEANDGTNDLWVGGAFTTYAGTLYQNRIIRLREDGTIATSFVTPGTTTTKGFNNTVYALSRASSGTDVFAGGSFTAYGGGTNTAQRFVRLRADGGISSGFPAGATAGVNSGTVFAIQLAPDDPTKVYLGGTFTTAFSNGVSTAAVRIAKMQANGILDPAFVPGAGFNADVNEIVPVGGASNDVFVGGNYSTYQGAAKNRLVRLTPTGAVNAAFNVNLGMATSGNTVERILVSPSNPSDLYVGGSFVEYNSNGVTYFGRINGDGTLDTTLDLGAGPNAVIYGATYAKDGTDRLYLSGAFTTYRALGTNATRLTRLAQDGAVDTAFDTAGGFGGASTYAFTVVNAADGSGDVYVGGTFTTYKGATQKYLARLNADGSLDTDFNIGLGPNSTVFAILPMTDGSGRVYVAGAFTSYNGATTNGYIIRLQSTGAIDPTFVNGSGFNGVVYALAFAQDGTGDVFCGGDFTTYNGTARSRVIRLQSSGVISPTFNPGTGFDAVVRALAPSRDGSGNLYVGGAFTTYQGASVTSVVRLRQNGSLDKSFDLQGSLLFNNGTSAVASTVYSVAEAVDGTYRIYVAGNFNRFPVDGVTLNRLARFYPDGSLDYAFAGSGLNNNGRFVLPVEDGSGDVVVTGDFTSYNGINRNFVTRISPDGNPN